MTFGVFIFLDRNMMLHVANMAMNENGMPPLPTIIETGRQAQEQTTPAAVHQETGVNVVSINSNGSSSMAEDITSNNTTTAMMDKVSNLWQFANIYFLLYQDWKSRV
jgi:hypothetical protein